MRCVHSPSPLSSILAHNPITTLHEFDFKDLKSVQVLDLSECTISRIIGNPFVNLTSLKELYLLGNRLGAEDLDGFAGPASLIELYLDENDFSRMPRIVGTAFPFMTQLHFSKNRIEAIRHGDLIGFPAVKSLTLRENRITAIDTDAFKDCCGGLNVLNLDFNYGLTHLPDISHLHSLLNLEVAHCDIQSLPSNICSASSKLELVNVEGNKLTTLPSFSNCTNLFSLIAASNRIREIANDTLAGLRSLGILKLGKNYLKSIPDEAFRDLRSLKVMDLNHNELTTLPDLSNSRILHDLDASYNYISSLPWDYLHNKTGLKLLYLEDNTLVDIPDLSHNLYLRIIDLSGNTIGAIPRGLFGVHLHLEELYLQDNQIGYIDNLAFAQGMILHILDLSRNRFSTFNVPVRGFPYLHTLRLLELHNLFQVPNPEDIPRIQNLNFTYPYHCCLWIVKDIVQPDLTVPVDQATILNETATPLVITAETDAPAPLPIFPSSFNPFAGQPCPTPGQLTPQEQEIVDAFQSSWTGLVFEVHADCKFKVTVLGTGDMIGDSDSEALANLHVPFEPSPTPRITEWRPIQCYPRPNPLTPCENLMDPWVLRAFIWAIWVLAVLGNAVVLFVLVVAREKVEVPQFLICNLAIADFFLGIYLAFLAIVDVRTFGSRTFYQSALSWQMGPGCKTAGFIAVFSSELSMYILVVLTLERLYTIANTFERRERRKMRVAFVVVVLGWLLAIGLAALPLVGVNSYTEVGICLPFLTHNLWDRFYIGLLLSLNLFGFLVIVASYIYIFSQIRGSPADQQKREVYTAAVKISLLIITTFCCWFPLALVGFATLGETDLVTASQAKFLIVFIYPLNACVNPFLYAFFTNNFRERFKSLFRSKRSRSDVANPIRVHRAVTTDYPMSQRGAIRNPQTPEELRRARQSRRAHSFSFSMPFAGDTKPAGGSPAPTPPLNWRGGRRSSLPLGLDSSVQPSSPPSSAPSAPSGAGAGTFDIPFRLGPRYAPFIPHGGGGTEDERQESSQECLAVETMLSESVNSYKSRLSIVNELPENDREEEVDEVEDEEYFVENSSAASSDGEYHDASDSVEGEDGLDVRLCPPLPPLHSGPLHGRDACEDARICSPLPFLSGQSTDLDAAAARLSNERGQQHSRGYQLSSLHDLSRSGSLHDWSRSNSPDSTTVCTPPPSCTECTKRGVACDSCPVAASHGARPRPSPSDNCPGPVSRRPVALLCSSGSAPLSSLSPSLHDSPAQDSKPSSVRSQSELPSSCRHSNSTQSSLSLCVALSHVSDQHTLDGAVVCSSLDSVQVPSVNCVSLDSTRSETDV